MVIKEKIMETWGSCCPEHDGYSSTGERWWEPVLQGSTGHCLLGGI